MPKPAPTVRAKAASSATKSGIGTLKVSGLIVVRTEARWILHDEVGQIAEAGWDRRYQPLPNRIPDATHKRPKADTMLIHHPVIYLGSRVGSRYGLEARALLF